MFRFTRRAPIGIMRAVLLFALVLTPVRASAGECPDNSGASHWVCLYPESGSTIFTNQLILLRTNSSDMQKLYRANDHWLIDEVGDGKVPLVLVEDERHIGFLFKPAVALTPGRTYLHAFFGKPSSNRWKVGPGPQADKPAWVAQPKVVDRLQCDGGPRQRLYLDISADFEGDKVRVSMKRTKMASPHILSDDVQERILNVVDKKVRIWNHDFIFQPGETLLLTIAPLGASGKPVKSSATSLTFDVPASWEKCR